MIISITLHHDEETLNKQIYFKNVIHKESEKFTEQVKMLIKNLTKEEFYE